MNILNAKPLAIATAICAAALATTSFGAGGMRSGPAVGTSSHITTTARVSAPTPTKSTTTAKASVTAHATGQPNQSCGSATAPNTPGNAAAAPGSAFNPDGKSGTVYAGQQPQNSKNPVSVSQYDVACSKQP